MVHEPRFMGWREWSPVFLVGSGEEVVHRRAIWSDEDAFGCSDSFKAKSWLAKPWPGEQPAAARRGPRTDAAQCSLPAVPSRSLLRTVYGERNLGKTARTWPEGTSIVPTLPSVAPAVGSQALPRRPPHSPEERDALVELAELMASPDSASAGACRKDLAERVLHLKEEKAQQARKQRDRIDEVSHKNRQKAALRQQRLDDRRNSQKARPDKSGLSGSDRQGGSNEESVRQRRLMKVLTRIQIGRSQSDLSSSMEHSDTRRRRSGRPTLNVQQEPKEGFHAKLRRLLWAGILERKRRHRIRIRRCAKREAEYQALPAKERAGLSESFNSYKDEFGTVDKTAALKSLVELGLRGSTSEEKAAVKKEVVYLMKTLARGAQMATADDAESSGNDTDTDDELGRFGELSDSEDSKDGKPEVDMIMDSSGNEVRSRRHRIGLYDFCMVVVPAARRELLDLRTDAHLQYFLSVMRKEQGFAITGAQLDDLAKSLDIGLDMVASACAIVQNNEAEFAAHKATAKLLKRTNMVLADHREAIKNLAATHATRTYEFGAVHFILLCAWEHTLRRRRRRERDIQSITNLPDTMFWKWRTELSVLYDLFATYDSDQSKQLSQDETLMLLKRIGMQPWGRHTNVVIERFLESAGKSEVDFVSLIALMDHLRRYAIDLRRQALRRQFYIFDHDLSGELSRKEAIALLHEAKITPTRVEQDIALDFFRRSDLDSSGSLDFAEMEVLTQRVLECIHAEATKRGIEYGKSLGFDGARIALLQQVFDQADESGKTALTLAEVVDGLLAFMVRPPPPEEVAAVYRDIIVDKTAKFGFCEFLTMMKRLGKDRKMVVKEPPFILRSVPEQKLRDILHLYPISAAYIDSLAARELLESVCNYTGYGADANLRDLAEPIRNPRHLLDRIRRLQGKTMSKARAS